MNINATFTKAAEKDFKVNFSWQITIHNYQIISPKLACRGFL